MTIVTILTGTKWAVELSIVNLELFIVNSIILWKQWEFYIQTEKKKKRYSRIAYLINAKQKKVDNSNQLFLFSSIEKKMSENKTMALIS